MSHAVKSERSDGTGAVPAATASPPLPRTSAWVHAVIVFGLLAINFALYHRTVGLGFLSVDDPDYVLNNPYLEHFDGEKLKQLLTRPYTANYAPATLLSYVLDVSLAGGREPRAIHLSNVLWHGWVACMVYCLAWAMRGNIALAATSALLFVLHPSHVEVVAWISSRKDLVATGFATLAMTSYLMARRKGAWRRAWYAGSVLSFLLACAGKQSVVLLPALMLGWDLWVEKRRGWRMVADKVPFVLIALGFAWATWTAQPSTNRPPNGFVWAATQWANLGLLTGLGEYVLYRPAPNPAAWSVGSRWGVLLLAGLAWAVPLIAYFARRPVAVVLGYWILLHMLPSMPLNFVVPVTDRYLFLPSVGVCILAAELGQALPRVRRLGRWVGWALLAALGGVWGAKTWAYVEAWRDPRSVWYHTHLKTTHPQVFQFLGEVYHSAGDRMNRFVTSGEPLAMADELRLARAILNDPSGVEALRAEWESVGPSRTHSIAYRDRLWELAWEQYCRAAAHRGTLSMPNLFLARGRLLVSQGRFAEAIPEFEIALRFAEASNFARVRQETVTHALFAIGVAWWHQHRYKEAEAWLLKAQAVQRRSGQAWIPNLDREVQRVQALAAGAP